ncbi:unnamed protein product [Caenorhabditis sp. 36 PRJEB53466]|nr:unnamed protein product [Caenorhabditis sp. 36 PRJEB53466]
MSSKEEPAQAPATVSPAESGRPPPPPQIPQQQQQAPAPQQIQHQHLPSHQYHQGQVIYQQGYPPMHHYQQQGTTWIPHPPQATVHYVQYAPQQDLGAYHDKVQGYNHYGTVHYAQPMDNGEMMMRGPQPYMQPQFVATPQWYPPGQPQLAQFIPSYATNFNVANDPTYHPNHPMNQSVAAQRDDFQAPIGMMESQAHVSASYTANWVSSTSSIPPEMKDAPEESFQQDNIMQLDIQRPSSQLNGDNWTERDEHFSPSATSAGVGAAGATAHYHSSQQSANFRHSQSSSSQQPTDNKSGSVENKKTAKPLKNARSDRNEEKRELTFDERLEKARMQKDRVESISESGPKTSSMAAGAPQTVSTQRSNGQQKREPEKEANGSGSGSGSGSVALAVGVGASVGVSGGGSARSEGYNNNNNNSHNNGRGRNNHHHQNGNNTHNGAGEEQLRQRSQPPRQQHQQQFANQNQNQNPVRGSEPQQEQRELPPRREYNQANRYEYNPQNQQFNRAPNQNPVQNQAETYRQPGYRGGRGVRGGVNSTPRGRGSYQPNYQRGGHLPNTYMVPSHLVDPQLLATINAFQNTRINYVPGVRHYSLLPGPFGMQMQQDAKFRNTWLDVANYPPPLIPYFAPDNRMMRGGPSTSSYRGGRGRGGFRGGHRGGYNSGYNENAAGSSRQAPNPAENNSREVKGKKKSPVRENTQEKVEDTPKESEPSVSANPALAPVPVKEEAESSSEKA